MREQRDLDLGGARVVLVLAELARRSRAFPLRSCGHVRRVQGSSARPRGRGPPSLAAYSASSARRSSSSGASPLPGGHADADTVTPQPASWRRAARPRRAASRRRAAAASSSVSGSSDQELLAAEAAELVLRAQVRRAARAAPRPAPGRPRRGRAVVDRLEVVEVEIAIESGCPWRRAPQTMPAELGEDEAAVGEPGERVLEAAAPPAAAPGRRAPPGAPWCARRPRRGSTQLAVGDRLDQEVLHAAAQRRRAPRRAPARPLEQHDAVPVGVRVALDRAQHEPVAAARRRATSATSGGPRAAALERLVGVVGLGRPRGRPRRARARAGAASASGHGPAAPASASLTYPWTPSRKLGRTSSVSDQRADLVHVAVHLLDQRLDGVEAPLAAEALEELQPQLLAVEVAVEVEQERLDEQRRGRSRTSGARRSRPPPSTPRRRHARAAGVDAVVGDDERRVGDEVRGREAERAPALVAVGDRSRASRTARRAAAPPSATVAGGDQAADVRRGDDLAVDLDQLRRRASRTRPGPRSSAASPLRAVAEAEVLADRDLRRAERARPARGR